MKKQTKQTKKALTHSTEVVRLLDSTELQTVAGGRSMGCQLRIPL